MAKRYRLELLPEANRDLDALSDWISEQSGSARLGLNYIRRIRAYLNSFQDFPHRGTKRDDIRNGLRITGFERRVTIAFSIQANTVFIARIYYAGRDIDMFEDKDE